MDKEEGEMGALSWGEEEAARVSVEMTPMVRVEITTSDEDYYSILYKAAYNENLQMVTTLLEGDNLRVVSNEWEMNPLHAVIMADRTRISVADILLHHYGHDLLLKARDPHTGNTLLHLAAQREKENLATFFLQYLAELKTKTLDPFTKQCFLDAVNNNGQTALHIASNKLLYSVVYYLVSEKQLKINIKDNGQKTAFDLINERCDACDIRGDWKKAWKIFILLRASRARIGSELKNDYEDEMDVAIKGEKREMDVLIKGEGRIASLIVNDAAWNMVTNMILAIATLAFAFIFAAIFTVPQTLASGGGGGDNNNGTTSESIMKKVVESLHNSLGKSIAFKVFVASLTLACLLMILVVVITISTVNASRYDMRALILALSWLSFITVGVALAIAYLIAIWIYMGYFFTSILIACGVFITLVILHLAHYFDLVEPFWLSLSNLLRSTLVHGFVVTLSRRRCFSKCCPRT